MTGDRSLADLGLEPVRLPAPSDPRRTDLYVGARTWMVQHGLHPDPDAYLEHGYVDLVLRAWPTAAGAPLHLATQWAIWTWLADDVLDQELRDASPEAVLGFTGSLLDVVAHKPLTAADHPRAHTLADLIERTRLTMPGRWWQRYRQELIGWIHAAHRKLTDYVQRGRTPTVREYQALRPADGGMLLAAMWTELATECVTPDWNRSLVQDLLAAFSVCGYLANDLAGADETFSAVAALIRSEGLRPRDAEERVRGLLRGEEARFRWLCTAASESAAEPRRLRGTTVTQDTSQFAQHLDRFRVALAEWTAASPRYVLAAPAEASR